jgi:FtsH-binding integral membrane protein
VSILGVCQWLQSLPWASGIKESSWQFPVIEGIHSLALSAMLWPAAILDLRLLGWIMPRRRVSTVAAQFLPWVWIGFTSMVLSGAILFAAEAVKCYNSPFFRIKIILIGVAGMNALVFHKTVFGDIASWDDNTTAPWRAKVAGGCSLAIWIGVVAMGRALAYA